MTEPRQFTGRLSLRDVIRPDDDDLLEQLYISVRDDLGGALADAGQLRQLLSMQFRAQSMAYERDYPNATNEIILADGDPVGRLIVERREGSIQLVEIALLPSARNAGIGTRLIQDLMAECERTGVPLQLQVLTTNRALSLYERLGFRSTGEGDAIRVEMKWEKDRKSSLS